MRHLRSILYALVLAPAVWTLCGVAFTQDLTGRARTEQSIEQFTGLLLLVLAGAAYAILLLPRLSPAGPALAGLAFLGVSVWALVDPGSFRAIWSPTVSKEGFDLTLPAYGLAVLLAVPLLCTALSARRWREHDHAPAATGAFAWPFARPAHPGTLVVRGVTDIPAAEATQVIPSAVRSGTTQVAADLAAGDRTQVITTVRIPDSAPGGRLADTTQVVPRPADETQVVGSTEAPADPTRAPAAAAAGLTAGAMTSVAAAEQPIDAPAPTPAATAASRQPDHGTRAAGGDAAAAGDDASAASGAPGEDRTAGGDSAPPGEKTQVISVGDPSKVNAAGEKTQVITVGALSPALGAGEKTQVISVGQQADALLAGEQTQVISAADKDRATAEGERTQAVQVSDAGEKTQVIGYVDPGDKTQLLSGAHPGTGTVQAPGDRTQVIKIPVPPGERTTVPKPAATSGEPTTSGKPTTSGESGEPRSGEPESGEDTTTVLSRPDDEPTAAVDTTGEPTAAVETTGEPTAAVETTGEPTAVVETTGEPTAVVAGPDDETAAVKEAPTEQRTEAVSGPVRRRNRPRQRRPSRQESTDDADRRRPH